jgi:hypothetical protein
LKIDELFFLNRDAAVADADFDIIGLMPVLVELVAKDSGRNGKHADNKHDDIAIHDLSASIIVKKTGAIEIISCRFRATGCSQFPQLQG